MLTKLYILVVVMVNLCMHLRPSWWQNLLLTCDDRAIWVKVSSSTSTLGRLQSSWICWARDWQPGSTAKAVILPLDSTCVWRISSTLTKLSSPFGFLTRETGKIWVNDSSDERNSWLLSRTSLQNWTSNTNFQLNDSHKLPVSRDSSSKPAPLTMQTAVTISCPPHPSLLLRVLKPSTSLRQLCLSIHEGAVAFLYFIFFTCCAPHIYIYPSSYLHPVCESLQYSPRVVIPKTIASAVVFCLFNDFRSFHCKINH